jgi:hypothetical protein
VNENPEENTFKICFQNSTQKKRKYCPFLPLDQNSYSAADLPLLLVWMRFAFVLRKTNTIFNTILSIGGSYQTGRESPYHSRCRRHRYGKHNTLINQLIKISNHRPYRCPMGQTEGLLCHWNDVFTRKGKTIERVGNRSRD